MTRPPLLTEWMATGVAITAAIATAGVAPAMAQAPDCRALLMNDGRIQDGRQTGSTRAVTTRDLAMLRDFGRADSYWGGESAFALSPDRSTLALQLRRGDPASNLYCQGLVLIDPAGKAPPRLIDSGGDTLFESVNLRGSRLKGGVPAINRPRWSRNGRYLAYLKTVDGKAQIWRVAADGSRAHAVTESADPVEAFAWGDGDRGFVYALSANNRAAQAAIAAEGRTGFLYGANFRPVASDRPYLAWSTVQAHRFVDATGGESRVASEAESRLLDTRAGWPVHALHFARQGKAQAWVAPRDPGDLLSVADIIVDRGDGRRITCTDPVCDRVTDLWWNSQGSELRFFKREGWAKNRMSLYRWTPGKRRPTRILSSTAIWIGCQPLGDDLVCARETSSAPKHLVRITMANGTIIPLYDPNPEFAALRLGTVARLYWKNVLGLEAFGDLVLPPEHKTGDRLPLIIVQYDSNGFLRGGTGDEYPIHPLALRGYAVLSVQRPRDLGNVPGNRTITQLMAGDQKDWGDRRSVHDSLMQAIALLEQRGLIDPARIGITGLSEGSASVQFGLINSDRFAAAIMSTCCEEPIAQNIIAGIATAREMEAIGRPAITDNVLAYWQPYSYALNAAKIRTPLLLQLADSEFRSGLTSFTYLRAYKKPVEMYIFPDETHVKWQPAHRQAIYDRAIDWFDFWLRDIQDPDPAKADQYRRWHALRDEQAKASGAALGQIR